MSGSKERPQWVVKDLANILGFDEETVKQSMLPDFENQNNEVRLRSQLQDFLGPTDAAKTFISRYLALRFPSLTNSSSSPALPTNVLPYPEKPKPSTNTKPRSKAPTPNTKPPPVNVEEALHTAFGPGGKVYQKNCDADDTNLFIHNRTPGGSGSQTPITHSQNGPIFRHAGALTIHEVKDRRDRDGSEDRNGKGKGKGKEAGSEKIWDRPKSREVRRLEGIMDKLRGLQSGEGKVVRGDDDMPDCFCQARIHPLSTYTPHCPGCGLTLCSLQSPHLPCPSCYRPTLSPAALSRLLLRIQTEIDAQTTQEQIQAERIERQRLERLAAESGGGAFPTLHGTGSSTPVKVDTSRKTLTIAKNDKGKSKAILTTTYLRPAPTPNASSNSEQKVAQVPDDIVPRPRSPPLVGVKIEKELSKVLAWRSAEDRPWGDKKDAGWKYVEIPITEWVEDDSQGRRRMAKKKKGVGIDGRVVPGAATA